jgi:serine/threonine protein kinase
VKPANLLISMGGVIKIGDFGTAAELGKGEDGHEGDTRYMAIELLESSDRYPSADIFSLGLTLYETCISCTEKYREAVGLGQSPLPNEGPFWHVLREGNAPDLPGRDAALCDVIKQAMSLLPADRPTTSSILAVPQVRDIALHRKPDIITTAAAALALEPHQLARAASFIESMSAIHRTSLQLLKAGKSPLAVLVPPEDHERASTPTASNGGSVSFWQPYQNKTWEDPDKSEESTSALPIESSMEYAPALTCVSLAPQRGLRDALGPPDHTVSAQDLTENAVLLDTSVACKYESTDWTLLSPSPSSPVQCWLNSAMKSRPGALSFPLPGGSRRRNKIYTDNEQFGKAKSSNATASTSPSRQASFRDSIQSCPLATPIPTIARYRYADSSTNSSCGPSSNTRSSITVGNGYGSTGIGSYRPMVPLGGLLQGGQRTMSGSLRRAGLETLSSGKEQSRGGQ